MVTRALGSLVGCIWVLGASAADPTPTPQTPAESRPAVTGAALAPGPAECAPDCAQPCVPDCTDCLCGPSGRVWVSAEWLFWAVAGNPVPALVTASPVGTARELAGVPGGPNTVVLFGGQRSNTDFRNGLRVRAGAWLDDCQRCGIEGDYFFLGDSTDRFVANSPTGAAVIGRPFFNAVTGQPAAQLVSFPGVLAGGVGVDSNSEFYGFGARLIKNLCCSPCGRFDLTLGYRQLSLTDTLTIAEDLTALGQPGVAAGTRFQILDRFRTENDFYGGSIGANFERRRGWLFFGGRVGVALGVTRQEVAIDGRTAITPPGGAPATFTGGLLAQTTNVGWSEDHKFAVVPEAGLRVGAQFTPGLRAFVGYDFLYWSNVARAGDQIDLRVNPMQLAPPQPLTGPAVPARTGRTTDLWVQGVSAGIEWRF